jgi:hypothetical protein
MVDTWSASRKPTGRWRLPTCARPALQRRSSERH